MNPLKTKLLEKIESTAHGAAAADRSLPNTPNISRERLSQWIVEVEPAVVVSALGLSGPTAAKLVDLLVAFRTLEQTNPSDSLPVLIEAVVNSRSALEAKSPPSIKASVVKQLSGDLSRLPGDAMFLASLGIDTNEGYVAYLRRIHEVKDHQVATTTLSAPHDAQFFRVARLAAPFVFALTQQLGSVFSSIGLPTAYELRRRDISELFELEHGEQV